MNIEQKMSIDCLAGAKYPEVVKVMRSNCLGIFAEVDGFGKAYELIKWASKSGRFQAIRVHGVWKDDHIFGDYELNVAVERSRLIRDIANTSKIPIYYSPFCEHEKAKAYMLKVFDAIRAVSPNLRLVNTPIGGGQYINESWCVDEIHIGNTPAGLPKFPYFVSFDGDVKTGNGSADADVETLKSTHSRAIFWFEWVTHCNLTKNAKPESKKPRAQRRCKPTQKLLNSLQFHKFDRGEFTLGTNIIYKSHSEQDTDNTEGETTANKPVVILPSRPAKLQIVTVSGKVLATCTKSEKYKHGENQWMYRFLDKWGFEYANLAKKAQGNYTCVLVADGKSLGKFNPGFRTKKK